MAVPIAGVRLGHSTTRRRGGRRPPPREDPAQRRRALAGGFDAPPAPALSSGGDDSGPHHGILDRKIAARLFRRCPRPGEARIMPDSYVSSMGSAFTETGYPPTADRDADRKLARLRTRGGRGDPPRRRSADKERRRAGGFWPRRRSCKRAALPGEPSSAS